VLGSVVCELSMASGVSSFCFPPARSGYPWAVVEIPMSPGTTGHQHSAGGRRQDRFGSMFVVLVGKDDGE
jgi:hypothetical protein